jgi:hypothetical protein
MAKDTKAPVEPVTKVETPAQPVAGVAAAQPARVRIASEPKRLSQSARKHIRRQKQAGEKVDTPRR